MYDSPYRFLQVVKGGNIHNKIQGTFAHPDLAIQIAQWCSPLFAIQVSRWTRELLITGSVTLGQEKSVEELEKKYKHNIEKLQNTVEEVSNNMITLGNSYSHLAKLHDDLRMNYS